MAAYPSPQTVFDLSIIGHACRLPGANDMEALWSQLMAGTSAVSDLPQGRWPVDRGQHPRKNEPGFSYTFAGGYIDDPFAFDPSVFGISPREAQQIDPQQRLLLEVVWEALEDAGLSPSATAREPIGVYVGASNVDYQMAASGDPAAMESHFMTGNSLSIISNRVSYIFDWRGPSFTVDSACSSSFVALAQAAKALRVGEIDTAIVAGVNLLLSPAPYIGFSRASMLSPTGRCRPFSAGADGYVRSEGAIAIVLRRSDVARAAGNRSHATIVGAGVNSDGRTSGISLPSVEGQRSLIARIYEDLGIDGSALAFVEAHGTGTPVGDPIEAEAIGSALRRGRSTPLPLGSVKSNIGHLECVSGLAGLAKATLAVKHGLYPRTLHLDGLNPNIAFDALNLAPAAAHVPLDMQKTPFAGVCNYGFGGTNAHVVLKAATPTAVSSEPGSDARLLVVSAKSQEALRALAESYASLLDQESARAASIASGARYQRELFDTRLAVPIGPGSDAATQLRRFARGEKTEIAVGKASARSGKVAFLYSGNGSQWFGMGRAALARNDAFRMHCAAVDAAYQKVAGWSLTETLASPALATQIQKTSVAQPLIFAIQIALTAALGEEGIKPDVVLGHSVGEVAAAMVSGALDLEAAIHLIHHRSLRQEMVAGRGRMLALATCEEQAEAFLASLGRQDLNIAAVNGPRSVTLSGTTEAIALAEKSARLQRIATVSIGVDYPFHSVLLDVAQQGILDDLKSLRPGETRTDFVSTVTGGPLAGTALDATYWWHNIREPVRFSDAVVAAGRLGATHFIEIGPRPILTGAATETLRQAELPSECISSLSERDDTAAGDPVRAIAAQAFVRGVEIDSARAFGPPTSTPLPLPHYPWQRQRFVMANTTEALELYGRMFGAAPSHPLLGRRVSQNVPEWRGFADNEIAPYLADHRVEGEVVVPAAAIAEMMLSVGREIHGDVPMELRDFDVLRALSVPEGTMREISTRFDETTQTCSVWARRRLSGAEFLLHAIGQVVPATGTPVLQPDPDPARLRYSDAADVYAAATSCGLNYGPSFQRAVAVERDGDNGLTTLAAGTLPLGLFTDRHMIDPAALDASLHALFLDAHVVDGETRTNLPVRIRSLRLWQPGVVIAKSVTHRTHESRFTTSVDITLHAADDSVVADVRGLVLREVVLSRRSDEERRFRVSYDALRQASITPPGGVDLTALPIAPLDAFLLLRGFVRSFVRETIEVLAADGQIFPARLVAVGRLAAEAEPRLTALMEHLAATGLAERVAEGWRLGTAELPASELLFRTLADRFPEANVEIRLAAHLKATLPAHLGRGAAMDLPPALADLVAEDGIGLRNGHGAIRAAVEERISACAPARPHIVLPRPWTAGLLRTLLPFVHAGSVQVTLAGADAAGFDKVASRTGAQDLTFFDTSAMGEDSTLTCAPVDLVAGLTVSEPFGGDPAEVGRIGEIAAGARCLIVEPPTDALLDILLFAPSAGGTLGDIESLLTRMNCAPVQAKTLADGLTKAFGCQIVSHPHERETRPALVLRGIVADAFAEALVRDGDHLVDSVAFLPAKGSETARTVIVPIAFEPGKAPRLVLAQTLLDLKGVLEWADASQAPLSLWLVTAGGRQLDNETVDPMAVAITAFYRVALNEHPGLDLRLIDVDAFNADAARRVRDIADLDSAEAERVSRAEGEFGVRVLRGEDVLTENVSAARRVQLDVPQQGAVSSMEWVMRDRVAPQDDQVEIEVAATGLNFRDVMLALGALDDDILGPGLTSASLGFECAGTVVRVGPQVKHLAVGDRVMGFAPNAFASHVTVPAWFAFKVPDGVSPEAAASIPVAFATAWYGLVECARLRANETVLVHGAAGGVGLAAVEIAHARGARVIATAGTPEKAELLKGLGVAAVYNSRDVHFAAEIERDVGKVDVVLNSLAGEAMTASLGLVKPFGRFVELGKRDFLANTSIGLRPFARNLSYFGVDLDQLLAHDPERAKAMMLDINAAFASGHLRPIPYRLMDGEEVEDAFRQMQAARHVGKIVVRPPAQGKVRPHLPALALRTGVHLVLGGNGGFGLETALWLASQTAGTVAIASRSGVRAAGDLARIEAARAAGARIVVAQADARDPAALEALVERLVADHGPLSSVIHTAMVLRDGAIPNLDAESLDAVLAPKVDGVLALDRITERHPVDHFIVYSSASAMIGSPGQGAYVAANAFLEGVVRNRRARGLPGLAVAWGAISDAGVIAKDQDLGQRLTRATGVAGIASAEALGFLGRLMAQGDAADVVNVYAQVNRTAIASQLPVLRTPTFPRLFSTTADGAAGSGEDLMEQLAGLGDVEARALMRDVLGREVAGILRLAPEAVTGTAALSELGMDSLMALELRLTLEKKFGFELPLLSIGSGRTLDDLAAVALSSLRTPESAPPAESAPAVVLAPEQAALAARHGIDLDAKSIEALTEMAAGSRDARGTAS